MEYEHVPLCLDQGVGIMAWSPLSGGFLAGKYKRGGKLPQDSRLALIDKTVFVPPIDKEKAFIILDELGMVAKNHNASMAQAALNYLINRPAVSTLVLGVRNKEQLKDNLGALEWKLEVGESEILDKVSEIPENYPFWHQNKHN
jgi:aryl-alcohol dehydrogenase-like predicted oxidoreductase